MSQRQESGLNAGHGNGVAAVGLGLIEAFVCGIQPISSGVASRKSWPVGPELRGFYIRPGFCGGKALSQGMFCQGGLSQRHCLEERAEAPTKHAEAIPQAKDGAIRHEEGAVQTQKIEGIIDAHGRADDRQIPAEFKSC